MHSRSPLAVATAATLIMCAIAWAGAPDTGLKGGIALLDSLAGYLFPTAAADCIAVGDEAVPGDKDFKACPNTAVWASQGYDAPTSLKKWWSYRIYSSAAPNITGDRVIGLGAWSVLVANNFTSIGQTISTARDLRVGNAVCTFPTDPTNIAATDKIVIRMWCCEFSDADFSTCHDLGVAGKVCGGAGAGAPCTGATTFPSIQETYINTTIATAGGTCRSLVFGTESTQQVDAVPAMSNMYMNCHADVEN